MMEKYKNINGLKFNSQKNEFMLTAEYEEIEPIVNANSIILNKDCFCNHSVHCWGDILMNKGSVVIGSVFSGRNITIHSGKGSDGQITSIMGDITAESLSLKSVNSDETILIFGNVYVDKLKINAETFIRGNLYVEEKITCNTKAFVTGMSKLGNPESWCESYLKDFGTFGLSAFGSLVIDHGCSVLEPLITVNPAKKDYGNKSPAKLNLKENVVIRVISVPCTRCVKTNDFLKCPLMNECESFSVLTGHDSFKIPEEKSYYISWYWRALPETILHHYFIEELYNIFLIRFNDDEIKYLLNNPGEFSNMYDRLLKEVINIDDSAVTVKKWLEKNKIPSKKVLKYFNIKDEKNIKEVFLTPEELATPSQSDEDKERIQSVETPQMSSSEPSISSTTVLDLSDDIFTDEFSLEWEQTSLPDIDDINSLIKYDEDNLRERLDVKSGNVSELINECSNIADEYEQEALYIPTKQYLHDYMYIKNIYDSLRIQNAREFDLYQDQFLKLMDYVKNNFKNFMAKKINDWIDYFGIPLHQDELKIKNSDHLKFFVDPIIDQMERLNHYLEDLIQGGISINIFTEDVEEVIKNIEKNITIFLNHFDDWLDKNKKIEAILDYKNALLGHYEILEDGFVTVKLLSILDRLKKLANRAGLDDMVNYYSSKIDEVESILEEESSEIVKVERILQNAQIKIKQGRISKELIQEVKKILDEEKRNAHLDQNEKDLLRETITSLVNKREEDFVQKKEKLEEMMSYATKISFEELKKELNFRSNDNLKAWLKKLIKNGLKIKFGVNKIEVLDQEQMVEDDMSSYMESLEDDFMDWETNESAAGKGLLFKNKLKGVDLSRARDLLFSETPDNIDTSTIYIYVLEEDDVQKTMYPLNPNLVLEDQIQDACKKLNVGDAFVELITPDSELKTSHLNHKFQNLMKKFGNIYGIIVKR